MVKELILYTLNSVTISLNYMEESVNFTHRYYVEDEKDYLINNLMDKIIDSDVVVIFNADTIHRSSSLTFKLILKICDLIGKRTVLV